MSRGNQVAGHSMQWWLLGMPWWPSHEDITWGSPLASFHPTPVTSMSFSTPRHPGVQPYGGKGCHWLSDSRLEWLDKLKNSTISTGRYWQLGPSWVWLAASSVHLNLVCNDTVSVSDFRFAANWEEKNQEWIPVYFTSNGVGCSRGTKTH